MKNSILDGIKCAIFDMDGTILESMTMWHTIADKYLMSIGKTPREDLWDNVKRLNMVETAEFFISAYGVEKTVEEIGIEVEKLIMKFYAESLQLKEGAEDFLRELNERKIPCVLATATERSCVLACMKRLDCEKYFCHIITCLDLNTSKSQPLIFEESARRCGAKPEESSEHSTPIASFFFSNHLINPLASKKARRTSASSTKVSFSELNSTPFSIVFRLMQKNDFSPLPSFSVRILITRSSLFLIRSS